MGNRKRFVQDGGDPTIVTPQIGVVEGTGQKVFTAEPQSIPSGYNVDGYSRPDQLKDNIYRSVYLNLSIPLFNGLQTRASIHRAVITNELAEITAKQAANTLRQSVETAFNDALAASKTYTSSVKQVNAREEAFRMMKQKFDAGGAAYVEYHVAENDLFQAKSDLLRAKYDFIFKKKLLDFYQDKPLQY